MTLEQVLKKLPTKKRLVLTKADVKAIAKMVGEMVKK